VSNTVSRRQFLAAAATTGAAAALPFDLLRAARAATPATTTSTSTTPTFYFLTRAEQTTCEALCARIVPSSDPVTDAPAPGATEAGAAVFIDRFLAAFMLPATVADNPAIYLHGRYSGRNPYPDNQSGTPSRTYPPDDLLTSSSGQAHFISLSPLQELSWRAILEGPKRALAKAPPGVSHAWATQVTGGTIPAPPDGGLQQIYRKGLAAFDEYSKSLFGIGFAQASPTEQDLMVEAAGNVVVSQVPLPAPPAAPADAKALFPYVVINTFQGTYGLPEYRWMGGPDSTLIWKEIGWDGDTQPLGNSIYDENLYSPGHGPNAGFGDPDVYEPRGGYKEYRPVSYLDQNAPELTEHDVAPLIDALEARGVIHQIRGGR
jgi:hypothetical protein